MSIAELKIDLINQISNINEKVKLEEISQLLKFQFDNSLYITSEDSKQAIAEGRAQIKNGYTKHVRKNNKRLFGIL